MNQICHPGPRAGIQDAATWIPDQVRNDTANIFFLW